jgi:hypothetical protein
MKITTLGEMRAFYRGLEEGMCSSATFWALENGTFEAGVFQLEDGRELEVSYAGPRYQALFEKEVSGSVPGAAFNPPGIDSVAVEDKKRKLQLAAEVVELHLMLNDLEEELLLLGQNPEEDPVALTENRREIEQARQLLQQVVMKFQRNGIDPFQLYAAEGEVSKAEEIEARVEAELRTDVLATDRRQGANA